MKTPLHKQLTNYIKLHRQVSYDDIQTYAKGNGYHAYTAIRRLQEVRQPEHRNYDRGIGTIEENGTIKWYIYKPFFASNSAPQQAKPAEPYIWTPRPKSRPITQSETCCSIFKASQGRMHAGGCETQKQIHS